MILIFHYGFHNQEELEKLLIPPAEINGGRKPRVVCYQVYSKLKSLVENRRSIFEKCYPISLPLAQKMLVLSYKLLSSFGQWDPVKVMFLWLKNVFKSWHFLKMYFTLKRCYQTVATNTRNI